MAVFCWTKTIRLEAALTPRETEIVRLITSGLTVREVASEIYRSHKTVECHMTNIYRKTGVNSNVRLTRWAIHNGLIEV